MTIDGYCKACGKEFDAHWTKVKYKDSLRHPICPNCGSTNTYERTDEWLDHEGE